MTTRIQFFIIPLILTIYLPMYTASPITSVSVFCGSSDQAPQSHKAAATALGKILAEHKMTLVYGGANVGLMGILADSALKHGGKVIGILPKALEKYEVAHTGITELIYVGNSHERKRGFFDRSDATVVLPGGMGTLDEFFDVLFPKQVGVHTKPIVLLNVNNYWGPLLKMLQHGVEHRYIQEKHLQLIDVIESPDELISVLQNPSDGFVDHKKKWWTKEAV